MTDKEFLGKMRQILDNENVTMGSTLVDIEEWDSLSVVNYMTMANTVCGKKIIPAQIRDCTTLGDLYALLMSE